MAKYEKPIVIANNEVMEGVYAEVSGGGSKWITLTWSNHNGGSHSVLECKFGFSGYPAGEKKATIELTFNGNGSFSVYTSDAQPGNNGVSVSGGCPTLTFVKSDNMQNADGNIEFKYSLLFDSTYDGQPHDGCNGSYYPGRNEANDIEGYTGDAIGQGDWSVAKFDIEVV